MLIISDGITVKQAVNIRLCEARRVMAMIEAGLLATESDIRNVNWADFGSLSHSLSMMEEAARALGTEPDAEGNNG